MGLTIQYTLKSKLDDAKQIKQTVNQMRQLALDLPFETVGDILDLKGKQCDNEARRQNGDDMNDSLSWLLIQASKSVSCPWNKHTRRINPTRIIAFETWPGHGCEAANFGLCLYPAEIAWEYTPDDDQRFQATTGEDRFSIRKWEKYCKRVGRTGDYGGFPLPASFNEIRKVPTKLAGWYWRSFCKTQYASDPTCGGIPNFLRCHISVVTLLDRMAKLPGLKVTVDDEGKYGPSKYSDDWKEAHAAGRKPTYIWHEGQYNPAVLAKEVGDWNAMSAALAGALSDALGNSKMQVEAPIKNFPDFEQLEFKGHNLQYLDPFLTAMKALAVKNSKDLPDEDELRE